MEKLLKSFLVWFLVCFDYEAKRKTYSVYSANSLLLSENRRMEFLFGI